MIKHTQVQNGNILYKINTPYSLKSQNYKTQQKIEEISQLKESKETQLNVAYNTNLRL